MSNPIRPFDWWMLGIEATVLLLAAYGTVVMVTHQIQRRARNKKLHIIAARLRSLIASGEKTKNAVPDYGDQYNSEWINSANSWIADVEKYLTSYSSERALIEFRRVTNLDSQQRKHIGKSGHDLPPVSHPLITGVSRF